MVVLRDDEDRTRVVMMMMVVVRIMMMMVMMMVIVMLMVSRGDDEDAPVGCCDNLVVPAPSLNWITCFCGCTRMATADFEPETQVMPQTCCREVRERSTCCIGNLPRPGGFEADIVSPISDIGGCCTLCCCLQDQPSSKTLGNFS